MPRTAPLANDLWLAAHDTPRGDSQLQPRLLGIGLGAALLAELTLGNWIWIRDDRIYLNRDLDNYVVDDDALGPLLDGMRDQVWHAEVRHHTEPGALELATWMKTPVQRRTASGDSTLQAGVAQELVELRLCREALIQQQQRGLIRKKTAWAPVNINVAGWPASRIRSSLRDGTPLSEQDLVLAGLLLAVGLAKSALADLRARHLEYLAQQTHATMRPGLHKLVVATETEVGRHTMIR
jgi:hypothetical protein